VTNEALQEAHVAARIDHRTLEAQGIDREPRPYIPRAAFEMERRGYRSVVAERMREEYRAREQARLERSAAREGADAAKPIVSESTAPESTAPGPDNKPRSLGDIQQEAVENWLRYRESQGYSPSQGNSRGQEQNHAEAAPAVKTSRVRDDDLAL
jgi:hypothetical protein